MSRPFRFSANTADTTLLKSAYEVSAMISTRQPRMLKSPLDAGKALLESMPYHGHHAPS